MFMISVIEGMTLPSTFSVKTKYSAFVKNRISASTVLDSFWQEVAVI